MKRLFTIIGVLVLVGMFGVAHAQAVAVDYTKAKASWTMDTTAGVGVPTAYTLKCGTATGVYTKVKTYPVVAPLTAAGGVVPISDLITTTGNYFCAVSAQNLIGESANSTEVNFQAGRVPPVPAGLAILP